ncbi:unnamed protein product [Durusdinium trenchii]|uniref:2-amino-1-hydroxyethylphosphonate dioxygenase (Glycine-forming) (Di-iron oxygenase) (Nonheme iron-dependent oxygenase) n=2 Tax=Durusdinium trenchii TaxID=1381693 RepID=A0ABP0PEA8_9DINO
MLVSARVAVRRLVPSMRPLPRSFSAFGSTSSASVDRIFQLFQKHGCGDYIGEEISQLEHALQAADLAQRSGLGQEATIAALLHDVGHLLGMDDPSSARMEDCGVVDHEKLGGQWLQSLGFSQKVCDLVARHVDGKRYLCAVRKDYHKTLSEASKTTLRHQGGPMTAEEANAFEKEELHKIIVAMRHWDEAAKVKGKEVPSLETYRELIEKNLIPSPA